MLRKVKLLQTIHPGSRQSATTPGTTLKESTEDRPYLSGCLINKSLANKIPKTIRTEMSSVRMGGKVLGKKREEDSKRVNSQKCRGNYQIALLVILKASMSKVEALSNSWSI